MSKTPRTDSDKTGTGCAALERELAAMTIERDAARATCAELVTDGNAITLATTVVRLTAERDEARRQLAVERATPRTTAGGCISMNFPRCSCGGNLSIVSQHAPPGTELALAALMESMPELPGVKVRCEKCDEETRGSDAGSVFRRISPEWGEEYDRLRCR